MPFDVEAAVKAGAQPGQIADFLASKANFDIDAARKAGAGDDQIISFLSAKVGADKPADASYGVDDYGRSLDPAALPKVNPDTPVLGPLGRGTARAVEGVANTADVVGAKGVGQALHHAADGRFLNAPSSIDAVKHGDLTSIPSAVLETVPQLLGAVGAGAAGSLAGPVGSAAALGAYGAATQGGDLAKARAANNGRAEPSASDIALGLGGAAALNALPGVGPTAGMTAAAGVKGFLGRTLQHAGADAAQAVGQEAVAGAGTDAGMKVDPAEIATQAVLGGVTRGAVGAVRGGLDAVAGADVAAKRAQYAKLFEDQPPEEQRSVLNTAAAYKAVADRQGNVIDREPGETNFTIAARSEKGALVGAAKQLVDARVNDSGPLTSEDAAPIRSLIQKAANSQQNALTPEDFQVIQTAPLHPDDKVQLADAVRQIAMTTQSGVAKRGIVSSALDIVGKTVGASTGVLVGGAVGHPFMGAHAGSDMGKAFAGYIGDKFGLRQPKLVADGVRAMRMLEASDIDIPDTKAGLMDAARQGRNALATLASSVGLDPTPYEMTQPEALAMKRSAANAMLGAPVVPSVASVTGNAPDPIPVNVPTRVMNPVQAAREAQSAFRPNTPADTRAAALQDGLQAASQPAAPTPAPQPQSPPSASPGPGADYVVQPRTDLSRGRPAQGTEMVPQRGTPGPGSDYLGNWQWRLGKNLQDALVGTGQAKPVNMAHEVAQTVRDLVADGTLPKQIATAMMQHKGAIPANWFNLMRNDMLLRHGIDRRTLSDQGIDWQTLQPTRAPMQDAAN